MRLGPRARISPSPAGAVGVLAAGVSVDAETAVADTLADVAAFKRPTRIVVRTEPIPRTTTRKAKRAALAAWIATLDTAHTPPPVPTAAHPEPAPRVEAPHP
jgi:acyl-coenzyme A synthetase/AMP-(fatty) acid ligase